jgi:hypothetical protein
MSAPSFNKLKLANQAGTGAGLELYTGLSDDHVHVESKAGDVVVSASSGQCIVQGAKVTSTSSLITLEPLDNTKHLALTGVQDMAVGGTLTVHALVDEASTDLLAAITAATTAASGFSTDISSLDSRVTATEAFEARIAALESQFA